MAAGHLPNPTGRCHDPRTGVARGRAGADVRETTRCTCREIGRCSYRSWIAGTVRTSGRTQVEHCDAVQGVHVRSKRRGPFPGPDKLRSLNRWLTPINRANVLGGPHRHHEWPDPHVGLRGTCHHCRRRDSASRSTRAARLPPGTGACRCPSRHTARQPGSLPTKLPGTHGGELAAIITAR